MKYQIGSVTRIGNREENEDSLSYIADDNSLVLMLADGMGGHKGGKLASQAFVKTVRDVFSQQATPIANPVEFLRLAITKAHEKINKVGAAQNPPISPRTTCVVCLIQNNHAWWAHLGDSRLYLFRHGEVVFRTRDHSKVEELMHEGLISSKEALTHPQRNQITRCLGGPVEIATITISEAIPLQMGDVVLLCSDGLWNNMRTKQMMEMITNEHVDDLASLLASAAEQNGYPKCDNISILLMRWLRNSVIQKAVPAKKEEPEQPTESAEEESEPKDEVSEAIEAVKSIFDEYEREIK